jgi:hypothetical protein
MVTKPGLSAQTDLLPFGHQQALETWELRPAILIRARARARARNRNRNRKVPQGTRWALPESCSASYFAGVRTMFR